MKILALTVGASPQPIVQSIQQHRPAKVIFFVTDRPDGGSKRFVLEGDTNNPSIVQQAKLLERQFQVVVVEQFDNFAACYDQMARTLQKAKGKRTSGEFIVDYTGGTKTMSAALATAACRFGWSLSLLEAPRSSVQQASLDGIATIQQTSSVIVDELTVRAKDLFDRGDYEGAARTVREALGKLVLTYERRQQLQRMYDLFLALAHWDRFEYEDALKHHGAAFGMPSGLLDHLDELAKWEKEGGPAPYRLVWDLAANAERRANQGRYEDAILRLYRSIELIAQIRMKTQYNIDTSNIREEDLDRTLDERHRESVKKKILQHQGDKYTAGLLASYQLLAKLEDPLGLMFKEKWERKTQEEFLPLRNKAFMTHGYRPLGEQEWERAWEHCRAFHDDAAQALQMRLELPPQPDWEWTDPSRAKVDLRPSRKAPSGKE